MGEDQLEKWERLRRSNPHIFVAVLLLFQYVLWFRYKAPCFNIEAENKGEFIKKKKRRINKKKDTKIGNLTTHMVVKEYLSKVNIIDIQDYYFLSWMISTSFIFIAFYNSKFYSYGTLYQIQWKIIIIYNTSKK